MLSGQIVHFSSVSSFVMKNRFCIYIITWLRSQNIKIISFLENYSDLFLWYKNSLSSSPLYLPNDSCRHRGYFKNIIWFKKIEMMTAYCLIMLLHIWQICHYKGWICLKMEDFISPCLFKKPLLQWKHEDHFLRGQNYSGQGLNRSSINLLFNKGIDELPKVK